MTSGTTSFDVYHAFGATIDALQQRRTNVVELIWKHQVENEGLDVEDGKHCPGSSRKGHHQSYWIATVPVS